MGGTSPGDDEEGNFERAGEMAQDWSDVAEGKKSARWKGGRFRNKGAGGCSVLALGAGALLVAFVPVARRARR